MLSRVRSRPPYACPHNRRLLARHRPQRRAIRLPSPPLPPPPPLRLQRSRHRCARRWRCCDARSPRSVRAPPRRARRLDCPWAVVHALPALALVLSDSSPVPWSVTCFWRGVALRLMPLLDRASTTHASRLPDLGSRPSPRLPPAHQFAHQPKRRLNARPSFLSSIEFLSERSLLAFLACISQARDGAPARAQSPRTSPTRTWAS